MDHQFIILNYTPYICSFGYLGFIVLAFKYKSV